MLVLRSYSRNYCCAWLLNALDNLASNGKTPAMFREREIWVSRSKELPLTQPSSLSLHLIRKCGPVPAGSAQSGLGEWAASLSRTSRELGKGPGPPGRSQSRPGAARAQAQLGRALGGQAGRPCARALDTARVPRPPEPQVSTGVWRPMLESARLRKDSRLETSLLCWH